MKLSKKEVNSVKTILTITNILLDDKISSSQFDSIAEVVLTREVNKDQLEILRWLTLFISPDMLTHPVLKLTDEDISNFHSLKTRL